MEVDGSIYITSQRASTGELVKLCTCHLSRPQYILVYLPWTILCNEPFLSKLLKVNWEIHTKLTRNNKTTPPQCNYNKYLSWGNENSYSCPHTHTLHLTLPCRGHNTKKQPTVHWSPPGEHTQGAGKRNSREQEHPATPPHGP